MNNNTFNNLIDECTSILHGTTLLVETNPLLKRAENFDKDTLKEVIINYSGFSNFAIHCLLDASIRVHKWSVLQDEVLDNIKEELGSETDNVPHLEMMRQGYKQELGIDTDDQQYEECTKALVLQLKKIFNNPNLAYLAGALIAFEGIAIPEFHIVDGIVDEYVKKSGIYINKDSLTRKYINGHKEFEIGHEQRLILAATAHIKEDHYKDFKKGYYAVADCLSTWWTNMHFFCISQKLGISPRKFII